MDVALFDYFRCPEELATLDVSRDLCGKEGFFRFGREITCYGQCAGGTPPQRLSQQLADKSGNTRIKCGRVELPFDLTQVVNNLRRERYASEFRASLDNVTSSDAAKRIYYFLRPLLPVLFRKHLQRAHFRGWE